MDPGVTPLFLTIGVVGQGEGAVKIPSFESKDSFLSA